MSLADLQAQKKVLDEVEARTVPGAPTLTPKQQMLDASDVEKRHPDKVIRWVNIRDPQKAESRRVEGYVRLSEAEGGRSLGNDLALMAIPRAAHEAKVQAIRKLNDERLNAHRREMESVAESVAKQMRDRYGVSIDASRILVDE